jgi:hypothetical protein
MWLVAGSNVSTPYGSCSTARTMRRFFMDGICFVYRWIIHVLDFHLYWGIIRQSKVARSQVVIQFPWADGIHWQLCIRFYPLLARRPDLDFKIWDFSKMFIPVNLSFTLVFREHETNHATISD